MFLPEMFPQCQFWIISTVFCPKWQLFASWIVQQFRRDTAYSGWNMVNARENATNGCFPNPYFWRIATTAFFSSWECFRYIFATWTRRPVPLSSCAKRRNNRDKWVRCKQKHEANNTNMADSVAKMVPSSKYRQYNGVLHPTSFGWDSDKILCLSLEKRWDRVRTRFASHYAGITRQVSPPKNYAASIISRREFKKSQETLNSKAKCLRFQGKGKRPNRAQPYTRIDEELFWSEGKFGSQNGVALTNVNFKNLAEHLGLRGR